MPMQMMLVWRRSLAPDLLDECFPTGSDQELALRLMLRLRAGSIAEPLVLMNRAHTNRLTMSECCRTSRTHVPNTPRSSPSTRPNLLASHARFALLAPGNGNPADAGKWARGRSARTRDGRETGSCPRRAFDAPVSLDRSKRCTIG
jgi:hypothetical protein